MTNPKQFTRRKFLSTMAAGSAVAGITVSNPDNGAEVEKPEITDTNINLFKWPFRRMKYEETKSLTVKLQQHRITTAWAGSFEAVFSKSINEVNSRLAEECRKPGKVSLVPFGAVNIGWPDWEEDLRRCHAIHKMPGILQQNIAWQTLRQRVRSILCIRPQVVHSRWTLPLWQPTGN